MINTKYVLIIVMYSVLGIFVGYHYLYFYNKTISNHIYIQSSEIEHKDDYINNLHLYDLTSDFDRRFKRPGKYDVIKTMLDNGLKPKLVSFTKIRNTSSFSDSLPVPNIVHLVHYGKPYKLKFRHYLHMMGTHKFIQPNFVFIHGDAEFTGPWWQRILRLVPNIYTVHHKQPREVFQQKLKFVEHASDFRRLQMLFDYGGIYFDNDILCVKSLDQLRKFDFTLDREGKNLLANGIMLARRHAPFIRIWIEAYRSYNGKWTANSLEKASHIQAIVPHLVHVEQGSLVHPTYQRMDLLYDKHYDWSKNYCIHLYRNEQKKFPENSSTLHKFHGASGEIMRYIWSERVNISYLH